MKKYILMLLSSVMMVSCVDTIILPEDKTVDEDFWKTAQNVKSMVGSAYSQMTNAALMERLIVWSELRSDELLYSTAPTGNDGLKQNTTTVKEDMLEIQSAAIQTDNIFNSWEQLYSVINYCNIVLKKAGGVVALDPDYKESTYLTDCSQMLALRSLCYFYLVRTFRDVPYVTEAYMESSQEMNLDVVSPDSVLQGCIKDLLVAEKNALSPKSYKTDWRRTGFITSDGINAILADIYLWLGAVNEANNPEEAAQYYEKCIECVDKVIAMKNEMYVPDRNEIEDPNNIYHLDSYKNYYQNIFKEASSATPAHELILEIEHTNNAGLATMYHAYINDESATPYLVIPSCYATVNSDYNNKVWKTEKDVRMYNSIYGANNTTNEQFFCRKMIETTPVTAAQTRPAKLSRPYGSYAQNWIVYRLTDILLMKAEALVQLAGNNKEDIRSRQAFNLVQAVNSRALHPDNLASDSLKWEKSNGNVETLVLAERARELCFEGKRWYDLLRYHYRHAGTDYKTPLWKMAADGKEFVKITDEVKTLIKRKYSNGAEAVAAKLTTEPYLYMPIIQSEIDVNSKLHQNPVYSANKEWVKDY